MPGVNEPAATQSSSEKLCCAGTRSEIHVPGDARVPSTACTRLPSASLGSTKGIRIVQTCNLTYCPTVTFVTIAAAGKRRVSRLLLRVRRYSAVRREH